jgi:hypothetical protein
MFLEKNWRNYCAAMHALQELNHITLHVVLKLLKQVSSVCLNLSWSIKTTSRVSLIHSHSYYNQFEPDNREELDRYTFSSSWEEVHPTTTRLLLML